MMNANDELTTFRKFNAFGGPIRELRCTGYLWNKIMGWGQELWLLVEGYFLGKISAIWDISIKLNGI